MSSKRRKRIRKLSARSKRDAQQQEIPPSVSADKTPVKTLTGSSFAVALLRRMDWQLWLFRVVAITVIPALLLVAAELGLRLIGYGYPTAAVFQSPKALPPAGITRRFAAARIQISLELVKSSLAIPHLA